MGVGVGRHAQLFNDYLDDQQVTLGAQSYRGSPSMRPMEKLDGDRRILKLFDRLFANEMKLCGSFAAFYHSYSHAALLYEVRAAVAAVLHGFSSVSSPLPRLLAKDFQSIEDAKHLMLKVKSEWGPTHSDHTANFRRVGISTMCSILATGPECCVTASFNEGYSCKGIAFRQVLEHELCQSFTATEEDLSALLDEILKLSERHGLDTCMFGGGPSPSGHGGHLLQIFVRRDLVDRLCYPAHPYGEVDEERLPFSEWMDGDHSFAEGQARIYADPSFFLEPRAVQMFVISADPLFQETRERFQLSLTALLRRFTKQQWRRHYWCFQPRQQPSPSEAAEPVPVVISVSVPENWSEGLPLAVTPPNGQPVLINSPPEGLKPGAVFQVSYVPKAADSHTTPAHAQLTVKVPAGQQAGSQFVATYPDGQVVLLTVPDGLSEGETFEVAYAPRLQTE